MRMAPMIVLCTLFIGPALPGVVAGYTPEIWSPRYPNTRCVIEEERCKSDLPALQRYMTRALNFKRSYVARGMVGFLPIATNMMMLENDETLNHEAQKYVEECIRRYGFPQRCPKPGETEGNVSVSIKNHNVELLQREVDREAAGRLALASREWGDNLERISQFLRSFDHSQAEEGFLDSFKMVHAPVRKVGCGIADYFFSEVDFQEIIACFYGPPILRDGEEVYKTGLGLCRECPSDASCVTEGYDGGLCKVRDVNAFVPNTAAPLPVSSTSPKEPVVSSSPPYSGSEDKGGNVIWKCDLKEYAEECRVEGSCAPHWTVDRIEGFKYVSVSGRCVTASVFMKDTLIKGSSCFIFEYQKEGSESETAVLGFASRMDGRDVYATSKQKSDANDEWNSVGVDIPSSWRGSNVQVGIIVRSLSTSDEQRTIKVRNFILHAKKCEDI